MTGASFTVTRHNGRADKKGQAYSVKHNDRSFNLENADHIDESRTAQNIYWDCMQGLHDPRSDQIYETFEDVEKEFYRLFYQESVDAQNKRNEERRHPERNKATDWLLTDRRTCPEESILQIGNIDGAVDGGVLAQIANAFFTEMEKRYGEYLHLLKAWQELYAPRSPDEEWHPLFTEALQKISYVEYLLDVLLTGTEEEKKQLMYEHRKEVKELEERIRNHAASADSCSSCTDTDASAGRRVA